MLTCQFKLTEAIRIILVSKLKEFSSRQRDVDIDYVCSYLNRNDLTSLIQMKSLKSAILYMYVKMCKLRVT